MKLYVADTMFPAVSFAVTVKLLFPVVMLDSTKLQSNPPKPFSVQLFAELKVGLNVPLKSTDMLLVKTPLVVSLMLNVTVCEFVLELFGGVNPLIEGAAESYVKATITLLVIAFALFVSAQRT